MAVIGDRVKSINESGAIQEEGRVVMLIDANVYLRDFSKNMNPSFTWTKRYPDWKKYPLAVVEFESPQLTATFEEWMQSGIAQGYKKEEIVESYRLAPKATKVIFPVQDLEVLND